MVVEKPSTVKFAQKKVTGELHTSLITRANMKHIVRDLKKTFRIPLLTLKKHFLTKKIELKNLKKTKTF